MTAKQMRSLGWISATGRDYENLVLGRRYLVANRRGTKVEAAYCNETLEGVRFWDKADTDRDELLGDVSQWPWFKEDRQ